MDQNTAILNLAIINIDSKKRVTTKCNDNSCPTCELVKFICENKAADKFARDLSEQNCPIQGVLAVGIEIGIEYQRVLNSLLRESAESALEKLKEE